MGKFVISSHGRLQDWIAIEKNYFADEGLEFEMDVRVQENAQQSIEPSDRTDVRTGAYELYVAGAGGKKDMSCACHWAVNQAATDKAGKMWGGAYSILPSAIFVRGDSEIHHPRDLAGVEVAVGYHSGSHFSTIQALEPFLETDQIRLRFGGMPYDRVDDLLEGSVEAAAVWSAPTYLLEQLGCRKILDTTFVAGFMFSPSIDAGDVERYMNGLRRAQMGLDLAPEIYKHYFTDEIPARYQDRVDVRCFGTGERIVFLPYTEDAFHRAQEWMRARDLFETATTELPEYRSVVQV